MNISFYTGRTGILSQSVALDVHSNNIANVQTNGYKSHRASFSDCLYSVQRGTQPEWQTGHGGRVGKTDLMYSQAQFYTTESPLDFALPNDGFFGIISQSGEMTFTRDGAFQISQGEDGIWQLTNNGEYVADYNGNVVEIPFLDPANMDYDAIAESIGVYEFANPYGLEAVGDNRYINTAISGEPQVNFQLDKVMYALERSNVDISTEMVKLIEIQRAYQLNAQVVKTSDEMMRISNNLR